MSVLAVSSPPGVPQPHIVCWVGDRAPDPQVLNVLAAESLSSARDTLAAWADESAGCAIVIALPLGEKAHVMKADLEGVAIVFPTDEGEDALSFVKRMIDEVSPTGDEGDEPDLPGDAAGVLDELLRDDYGLGPRTKADWINALNDHGSDV